MYITEQELVTGFWPNDSEKTINDLVDTFYEIQSGSISKSSITSEFKSIWSDIDDWTI